MRQRGADVLEGASCVIPVPLHPSRRRRRGFNQAADLAAQLGLPVVHALRRTRRTKTQTELPAAQRHRNVRGAFAPTGAAFRLVDAVVVLVDDVSTTGATLDACARALKGAGVREVRALTAARAVSRSPGQSGASRGWTAASVSSAIVSLGRSPSMTSQPEAADWRR